MTVPEFKLCTPTGELAPGAWDVLAEVAENCASTDFEIAADAILIFRDLDAQYPETKSQNELSAYGLAADTEALNPPSFDSAAEVIGWFAQPDGLVSLGASLPNNIISAQLARMLAVIGTRSTLTAHGTIFLHDMSEAIAEQVLKVLAPLGLNFDAERFNF
ncbi:hypothetical protein [Corynebacterium caspium]|uniref:hypothetical protein n=1 Tax=Corynebacterium caspium TaxID=234828 RepID=UPI00035C5F07|nr:hypothetical protein [Corynebacterium caspium]WKD59310.1 hypothetical protein CCASP_04570 [Corynebacterium caspium DSM 44850]